VSRKITIVAATASELHYLQDHLSKEALELHPGTYQSGELLIDILITGIGIVHSTYSLMDYLSTHQPDAWIQVGIGGAIDRTLEIGKTYVIQSESMPGFGAQDKDGMIITPFQLGWCKADDFPFQNELLVCKHIPSDLTLPKASGMTSMYAHGFEEDIKKLSISSHGQIESMEGFPFFYVSLMKNIPFLSLRSISNYVEPRNKENWEIDTAVRNLNEEVIKILKEKLFYP
jgi:futalosine hydrolase